MSIKKNIPNVLSTIRLLMALGLPFMFFSTSIGATTLYYLAANITDIIDGALARKWKVQSRYGKVVDPFADKLLNITNISLASFLVNPFLFSILLSEVSIATINSCRALNMMKFNKIDKSNLTFKEKSKLFLKLMDKFNVARIGRVKAVCIALAAVLGMLAPTVPELAIPSFITLGIAMAMEIPVISKYAVEYYVEKGLYKMESLLDCEVSNKDLDKLKQARKILEKFQELDRLTDKITEDIKRSIVKMIKPSKNEVEPGNIDKQKEEIIETDNILEEDSSVDPKESGNNIQEEKFIFKPESTQYENINPEIAFDFGDQSLSSARIKRPSKARRQHNRS